MTRSAITRSALACIVTACLTGTTLAIAGVESSVSAAADTQTSAGALKKTGEWVYVPIPVSNPTFGNGLQLGALYLHQPTDGNPAATSGAGAMVTDNGSRVVGLFHDQSFQGDKYRLTGFIGTGRVAFKYYGSGASFVQQPIGYDFVGTVFRVTGLMRVADNSSWFVGLNLEEASVRFEFDAPDLPQVAPDDRAKLRIGALGPELLYDSRDDKTYPNRGQYFALRWFNYRSAWGSQIDYDKVDADYSSYWTLTPSLVGAARARYQAASSSTPFFDTPSLGLRGFASDRYRDDRVVSVHGELRYAVLPRWGVLAFAEGGRAAATAGALRTARTITSYGVGARWQASEDRRLYLGVVAAFTTETNAVFIAVGENF